MHNCKNFKWNTVKMVKNGKKWVKHNKWPSYMLNNNICNNFSFLVFSVWYLYNPFIFTKSREISSENRVQKIAKRISGKTINVSNVIIYHMWWPKNIFQPFFALFWPFLPYFTWNFCNCAKFPHPTFSGHHRLCSAW